MISVTHQQVHVSTSPLKGFVNMVSACLYTAGKVATNAQSIIRLYHCLFISRMYLLSSMELDIFKDSNPHIRKSVKADETKGWSADAQDVKDSLLHPTSMIASRSFSDCA